ncbi:pyridine nucleotide-disulfide oxidoreductase [Roseobacter cerasinus]|uniref:Pyridine nucleotide-disulfide oxidoreductase n=1 Tax=Roseobacter cerasinus TaxID=2602289 RepID=A0A640VTY2_9RHOB|nr:FAD-dependent oxidoreductase [Roseobacter cerasinus]GFE49676.1 pyridine nucleotide-disulfide oxidoreductase [Roseobacter cerasinus]
MTARTLRRVALVGGGHTHALVLRALRAEPLLDAEVTVINPGRTAPYSGMLPGFVAGHYQRHELDIDLQKLADDVGATLIDGRAVGMDVHNRLVHLADGSSLPFDLASIDVGITSRMQTLPGFEQHGIPAKPLADFAQRWEGFRSSQGSKQVAVIGGGIAGAELAMAMAFALREHRGEVSVRLLDRGRVLSANSQTAQRHVRRELARHAVEIVEGVDVSEVTASDVRLSDGTTMSANFIVGAAGATPHDWLGNTGLKLRDGFIEVDPALQSNVAGIFAVGDCAHMVADPRPKAGVYAVRQAPILLANLRNLLSGSGLQGYRPQSDYLKLVSLGGKRAFGEKLGWGLSGHLIWRLKNRIDRNFMDQF